jgi:hypothetical protein
VRLSSDEVREEAKQRRGGGETRERGALWGYEWGGSHDRVMSG